MAHVRIKSPACVVTADCGVILHSDLGTFVLEGRDITQLAGRVVPLLDGTRGRDSVTGVFSAELQPFVGQLLDILERQGLLEGLGDGVNSQGGDRWEGQEEFLKAFSEAGPKLCRTLGEANVVIVGLEPWGITAATELAAAGVGNLHVVDEGHIAPSDLLSVRTWHAGLVGVQRREALKGSLRAIAPWCQVTTAPLSNVGPLNLSKTCANLLVGTLASNDLAGQLRLARVAHEAFLPSLFVHLDGMKAMVGPAVLPGKTACWNCCRLRMLANADHPEAAHALQRAWVDRPPTPRRWMSLAPMAPLVGHIVALQALKLLTGCGARECLGRLLVQNLITLERTLHTVVPMPWCEVCGGASVMRRDEVLQAMTTGELNINSSENVGDSLPGWIDARTGVIASVMLRKPEPLEASLPICVGAILSEYTEGEYQPRLPEGLGGKGVTEAEAMLGAIGESIERYSASRVRVRDLHRSRMSHLEGEVLDPRQLCLYDEAQYDRPGFPFPRFDPDVPHLWTRGRWIDTGESVWVPAALAFYCYLGSGEDRYCQVTSNGLAAGKDYEDASLRAICETVERDAFMLTWLCRLPGRRLAIEGELDSRVSDILRQLQECGAQIELYLLESGLDIPTVLCLGIGDGCRWPGVTVTSAAHLSPRIAATKAILEQGYSGTYIRRKMLRNDHAIPTRADDVRTFLDHALYYVPKERLVAFDFLRADDRQLIHLSSLREPTEISVRGCALKLASAGIRIAMVDLTAPDVALSPFQVVRALGTYLQPLHCGFGLERGANPRLQARLEGPINAHIHPLC
jgi:ribosomal protein S12 methylthiotransferase accessory factor